MPVEPEEREFQLEYYGLRTAFSLQLYRSAGATALAVVTPTVDEAAYQRLTIVAVTYTSAAYRLDVRHLIWVERTPGVAPELDSYTLVEFDRTVSLLAGRPLVTLDNPVRSGLSHAQLLLIQSRLGEEGAHP
jgi:hypothetical protein